MEIRLSNTNGLPVYRQIVNQVKYLVASGRLQAGQELPTLRTLAERLVINPNTVVHAYGELEREGVIVRRHGSGTYVADTATKVSRREATQTLTDKIDSLLVDASHLQVQLEDILEILRERHQHLNQQKKP
jgi:GntR family transcriptional regulator